MEEPDYKVLCLPRSGSSHFTNYFAGDSEGTCGAWHHVSEFCVFFLYGHDFLSSRWFPQAVVFTTVQRDGGLALQRVYHPQGNVCDSNHCRQGTYIFGSGPSSGGT
ncbi:hypothetical protein DFH08DRAFT_821622 [Mycena albidolilacea]|uniref:Uncharacterized protein n=1 Tax=Mycena albidolilacea TaxID=1033008 RepID=A0AAD6ZA85_9AGAR|nr:hypothetical protein DFH08DRAFT_821622 [Mycena albidolilacea]